MFESLLSRSQRSILFFIVLLATFRMLPEFGFKDIQLDFHASLEEQYPWATPKRTQIIRDAAQEYNLNPYLIAAIIDKESDGRPHLQGPLRRVKLYRKGKIVQESHRAIGLMQVMSFYSAKKNLRDEKFNIYKGTKILHLCTKQNEELVEVLRCYNSGQNSKVYNYRYIESVITAFQTSTKEQKLYASHVLANDSPYK